MSNDTIAELIRNHRRREPLPPAELDDADGVIVTEAGEYCIENPEYDSGDQAES